MIQINVKADSASFSYCGLINDDWDIPTQAGDSLSVFLSRVIAEIPVECPMPCLKHNGVALLDFGRTMGQLFPDAWKEGAPELKLKICIWEKFCCVSFEASEPLPELGTMRFSCNDTISTLAERVLTDATPKLKDMGEVELCVMYNQKNLRDQKFKTTTLSDFFLGAQNVACYLVTKPVLVK